MPDIFEFKLAIREHKNEIIKLQAMKMLLSNNDNKARLLVNGLITEINDSDSIVSLIDSEIKKLEEFNEEYEVSIK